MSEANSHMHGGNHYRKVDGEQHWDRIVRLYPEHAHVYFIGCATAYIERYRDKNGVEDLLKARHFIDKLIEVETNRAQTHRLNGTKDTQSYDCQVSKET